MKTLLIGMFLSISAAHAETNSVLVTNLVTAADNFREVNGRLYNIEKSDLWKIRNLVVRSHTPDGVIVQEYEDEEKYRTVPTIQVERRPRSLSRIGGGFPNYSDSDNREYIGKVRNLGQVYLLRNLKRDVPDNETIAAWSIMVGPPYTNGTQVLKVLDSGKPHVVPVVKRVPQK